MSHFISLKNLFSKIIGTIFVTGIFIVSMSSASAQNTITVTGPSGGEQFRLSDTVLLTWTDNYNPSLVEIVLYPPGSTSEVLATRYNNSGSYNWTIPTNSQTSESSAYRIRVYEMQYVYVSGDGGKAGSGWEWQRGSVYGTSGDFYIVADRLNFTTQGGITKQAGSDITLQWDDNLDESLELHYENPAGSGNWRYITAAGPSASSYIWTTPSGLDFISSTNVRIRSTVNSTLEDFVNNITLTGVIDITSPAGGADYRDREQLQVRWNSNLAQYVEIILHTADGSSQQTLSGQTTNDGAFDWVIPANVVSDSYYVAVYELEEYTVNVPCDDGSGGKTTCPETRYQRGDVFDTSPTFTLTRSYLNFTTSGNQTIAVGQPFDIGWNDNINSGNFELHYWAGGAWQPLATAANTATTYSWQPPASLDGQTTQIRIRSTAYPHLEDTIGGLDVVYVPPFVDLSDPQAGDSYQQGQTLTVRFATNIDPVDIDLVSTGGQETTIDNTFTAQPSTPSDPVWNTKNWTIPSGVADGQYRVRVSGAGAEAWSGFFGIGDGVTTQVVSYDSYDQYGNLLQATDAGGNVVEYFYGTNTQPLIQSTVGINGAPGVYLTGIRRTGGSSQLDQTAGYDPLGRLQALTDPSGVTKSFRYDSFGRLDSVRNDAGQPVTGIAYMLTGVNFSATNPNHIRTTAFDGTGSDRIATEYLDGLGRPVQLHQQMGADDIIAATTYDPQGRPERSYKPYRANTGHSYDGSYDVTAQGAYGNSWPYAEQQYEASPLGRPAKAIPEGGEAASGAVTTAYEVRPWTHNGQTHNCQVTTTTDESGNVTETWSDGWGRTVRTVADPVTAQNPSGINAETKFEYDVLDRLTKVTAPNNTITTYSYDARGQLVSKTSDDAGTVRYKYDGAGNLRFSQDANRAASGEFTYTGYDPLARPVREGVAGRDFASAEPDTVNPFESKEDYLRGLWAWDGKPNTTEYPWNQGDFAPLIGSKNPTNTKGQLVASAWRFGELETVQDSTVQGLWLTGGAHTVQAADSISAYNTEIDSGATLTLKAGRIIRLGPGFHAKAGAQLTAAIDPALATTAGAGASAIAGANPWQVTLHSYDDEGRLADKWIWTGDRREWDTHLAYEYNRQGELIKRKVTVAGQTLYQFYEYDQRGLLASVFINTTDTKPATPEVTYSYTASGAVETIDYKGSKDVNYGYTIRDWVASINDINSPAGNFAADYNYFDNGNVSKAQFHNPQNQITGHDRYHWSFGYDGLKRLTSADYGSGASTASGFFDVTGLSYDAAGNLTGLQRDDETGSLIDNLTYNYVNGTNRLGSVSDVIGATVPGWDAEDATFSYDAGGNLVSQSGKLTSITYDHRNLPTQFALASNDTLIANYNADGQRILKELKGGSYSFYVMDRQQTLAVIDQNGLSHMNLVGNQTFGRIEASSGTIDTSNARRYYVTDHLGSTRAVVDDAGNVLETFDYYPFGLLMPKRSSTTGNTIEKFTGKERDEAIGLDYFGARYMDPALGRWLSRDPLASKYPSISPYSYVANDPVNAFDPDGRLIVFINGMHGGSGSWPNSTPYWNNSGYFAHAVMDHFNDYNAVFVDGSVGGHRNTLAYLSMGRSGNLSAKYRYNAGYRQGKSHAARLIGLLAPEETLKIITHSMGAVYGKGYVAAIKEYIMNSDDPKVRKTLISVVADFDPYQAGSDYGAADPDIFTQQFWHDGGSFGIADQVQDGVDENNEDKNQKGHGLGTFLNDIQNLREGTYKWNDEKEKWICTSCRD